MKQLTQADFAKLKPEWQWAAVDSQGFAFCFTEKPVIKNGYWNYPDTHTGKGVTAGLIGGDFDVTNWNRSLIEREVYQ